MATKRQAPSDGDVRQPSKRSKPSPYNHQQRPAHHGKKSFKKAHPVNELKSTVRNLRRLLDRNDDLPANIRIEKERALQTAERELREAEKAKKRSDVIGKWHKIRFFDRQKAERRLKKFKKEHYEFDEKWDGIEWGRLRRRYQDAEVDVNYAMYYPLEKDYVPLFPRTEREPEVDVYGDVKRKGDPKMWEVVKRCTDWGNFKLVDLREGRLDDEGNDLRGEEEEEEEAVERPAKKSKKAKQEKPAKAGVSKHVQDEEDGEESEDETGGGFFE